MRSGEASTARGEEIREFDLSFCLFIFDFSQPPYGYRRKGEQASSEDSLLLGYIYIKEREGEVEPPPPKKADS